MHSKAFPLVWLIQTKHQASLRLILNIFKQATIQASLVKNLFALKLIWNLRPVLARWQNVFLSAFHKNGKFTGIVTETFPFRNYFGEGMENNYNTIFPKHIFFPRSLFKNQKDNQFVRPSLPPIENTRMLFPQRWRPRQEPTMRCCEYLLVNW